MTTLTGTNGNDLIDGGNGSDTIYGLDGDDIIFGGNGGDILDGGAGNDQLFGENGHEHLYGGEGDDLIDGNNGFDTVYYTGNIDKYTFFASAGYLHIVHQGGAGLDGHDMVIRVERLVFADRVIDLDSGHNRPVAIDDFVILNEDSGTYNSGAAGVLANDYDFDGDAMSATGGVFVGAYGTLTLNSDGTYSYALSSAAQALGLGDSAQDSFSYTVSDNDGSDTGTLVFTVTGLNDAPVANPDSISAGENQAGVVIDVLANDADVDNGAVLTVTAASAPAGQGSASTDGSQVSFDPGSDFESLAVGESQDVTISYDISDEHGATSSSTVTVTVTGENDGPVANPDTDSTGENVAISTNVVANDTDVDNGAVLTVTAASAPNGQGSASAAGEEVGFDPGTDFDDLAVGETEEVVVAYTIEDEHGAAASSTLTITVSGANDGPVANPDAKTTSENSAVVVDVLANDDDVDNNAVLTVTSATGPAGKGTVTIVEDQVRFDPGDDFDHLASGESEVVVINYTIEDEFGASASSTATITVQGRDEGTSTTGTNDGETLIGTPGDDTIDALGGDDNVFGLAGDDLLIGGSGVDFLSGDEDNDTLEGGNDNDFLAGGEGNDLLSGQAGNDSLSGEEGEDQLSGGDGLDTLNGGAGDDVIEGGNDDDSMYGEDGNDEISGQAGADILSGDAGDDELSGGIGNDSLDGGEGDDSLNGGDGEDFLAGGLGTNSLTGGLGNDNILAISTDGAQTIDGGDGNDTIRHYYRSSASTITTGSGSDTIEIAYANVGTEVIVVTDFAAGAGGDVFKLSGDDGSLLSLLSGWDGGSNPFGAGFLRLVQDGTDTLLQWDQDGSGIDSDWETLVVFESTDPDDFTEANFVPAYHPDGSAPEGQTITGTNDSDSLTGTFGDDTINALAGDDGVSGLAGADTIDGGDGFDSLNGGAGNDVIVGGNDDDFIVGEDGNDQLSGDAGNDVLFGDLGDDQLQGGDGDDQIDGSDGDDALTGGDGQDLLSGGLGTNSLSGGLGNDQIFADSTDGAQTIDGGDGDDFIRHSYRSSASSITTGSGSDTIQLVYANVGGAALVITDFTAGAGGDVFTLSGGDGSLLSLLSGWDGSSNPFGEGFFRLQQNGADTLFQWDPDGAEGGSNWETLAVLENTDPDDFTEANFAPGYHPDGDPPAGETITGTADSDTLTGTIGDDIINALGGDDFVTGESGADTITGGDGFDYLNGNGGDDIVAGGNDDDFIVGEGGGDQLSGDAGNDILFGQDGNDAILGGDGDDSLDGNDGDDTLGGGSGQDYLSGGAGSDVMTGGADADLFDLQSASDGPDEITDFASGSDKIRIWESGFGGGLSPGNPVSLVSGSAPTATEEFGQFLYDTDDGSLFWDADGTGSGDAVLIATFTSVPALDASDFFVI
ncbi:MAG TPA: Ig-like domain-containing protein [Allosphingosinicella sp.]|nr:Ig-like domain-containing protein [Allosphingosinicella sp.]